LATTKIFRQHVKTPFLFLLGVETFILFTSVYSAAYLRMYPNQLGSFVGLESLLINASVIAVITPIAMLSTGLYQGNTREGISGILIRISVSFVGATLITALISYLLPDIILSRGIIALAFLQAFFVIGTLRVIFFELIDSEKFKKRILVYGAGETALHIDSKLRRTSDRRGFEIIGYIPVEHQIQKVHESKVIRTKLSLLEYVRQMGIEEIVIAISDTSKNIPVEALVNCKLNGVETINILSFFEREAGQIRVDIIDPAWLVTSDGFHQSQFQDIVKRVFDILASFVILLLASPFLLLTIIAILIEDGLTAPIFYSQIRVGKRGSTFKVYKFRSMRTDAEKEGAVWASKTDSRVTRVGSFIRKTRLDEFPQIANVLNGTMSFVGPRPERPEFIENLAAQIPYYHERHIVKPGVTGWAQLLYPYGASVNDSYQKQLFDMYYVKNHNLFLDILILLQTVEVVLFGKGAR
jgi:sugar transferase (PEP-CTERM system associated)